MLFPKNFPFPVYPKNLLEDEFRDGLNHPTEVRLGSVEISVKFGGLMTQF